MEDGGTNAGARASTEQRPFVVPSRFLTDGIEGIGGILKSRPEDFLVEEIPLYEPSGEGEHLYLMIEKRGLSTFDLLNIVARHFDVQKKSIGYAGLKDKHAITRQMISVHLPGKDESAFRSLDGNRITVLGAFRQAQAGAPEGQPLLDQGAERRDDRRAAGPPGPREAGRDGHAQPARRAAFRRRR